MEHFGRAVLQALPGSQGHFAYLTQLFAHVGTPSEQSQKVDAVSQARAVHSLHEEASCAQAKWEQEPFEELAVPDPAAPAVDALAVPLPEAPPEPAAGPPPSPAPADPAALLPAVPVPPSPAPPAPPVPAAAIVPPGPVAPRLPPGPVASPAPLAPAAPPPEPVGPPAWAPPMWVAPLAPLWPEAAPAPTTPPSPSPSVNASPPPRATRLAHPMVNQPSAARVLYAIVVAVVSDAAEAVSAASDEPV